MLKQSSLWIACALLGGLACAGGHSQLREPATTPKAETSPASATAPGAAQALAIVEEQFTADTLVTTGSGATFTAPHGWTVTRASDVLTVREPDGDFSIQISEFTGGDVEGSVAQAWKRVRPDFERRVTELTRPPASDGWDEIVDLFYETSSNEQLVLQAFARRKDSTWYLMLLDGSQAALSRQGAGVMRILQSFKAVGVIEESFAGKTALLLDAERLRAFEAFAEKARTDLEIPGAAIALIQGGRVVFEKGFGVRSLDGKEPVTSDTLFMIGSITKPLTSLMVARLVDEGRFGWDTPVTQVLPFFALADPDVASKVTVAHTLCACTGLPRQDLEFLFEYARATPESRVEAMKSMKPTTGFGEIFQYSNAMLSAGGLLAAHAADPGEKLGAAYDRVMETRVFGPLGMKSTTFDFKKVTRARHAAPHARGLRNEFVPLGKQEVWVESVRPAAGAWSNVGDMARYVQLELAGGLLPDGSRVLSEASLRKRYEPQVKMGDRLSYGLGLIVEDDHGAKILHHSGNMLGFTSDMFFLPEHGVGAVILTNGGSANGFNQLLRRRLLELLFDGREQASTKLAYSARRVKEVGEAEAAQVQLPPDPAWFSALVGKYQNAALGEIELRMDGAIAVLDAGEWVTRVGRKQDPDGIWTLVFAGPYLAGVSMIPGEENGRATLKLPVGQHSYLFVSSPDRQQPTTSLR